MKNKSKKKKPKYLKIVKSCKGKKGGCYWEGEPEGITELRIAA